MKDFIRNGLYTAEKTIVIMCILTACGIVSNGDISLEVFRRIMIYSAALGFFIGGSLFVFDIEKLNTKVAYVIHFVGGYAALNILEGLISEGRLLPSSPPINYLFKLVIYLVAYVLVVAVSAYSEKRMAKKMADRIEEIKAG